MTLSEKEEYLLQQLEKCTGQQREKARSQMHRAESYNIPPKDFRKWVADTKKTFENEATPEELSAVFDYWRV